MYRILLMWMLYVQNRQKGETENRNTQYVILLKADLRNPGIRIIFNDVLNRKKRAM